MKYATMVMRPDPCDRSFDQRYLFRFEDNYWTVRAIFSHGSWSRTKFGWDPWNPRRALDKEEAESLRELSEEEFTAYLFEAGITL